MQDEMVSLWLTSLKTVQADGWRVYTCTSILAVVSHYGLVLPSPCLCLSPVCLRLIVSWNSK